MYQNILFDLMYILMLMLYANIEYCWLSIAYINISLLVNIIIKWTKCSIRSFVVNVRGNFDVEIITHGNREPRNDDRWFVDNGRRGILTLDPSGFARHDIFAGVVGFSFVVDAINGCLSFWSFINWETSIDLLISFTRE